MMIISREWWTLALRGLAAVIFGILALVSPRSAFMALVLLFGAYALVDGALNLIVGVTAPGERRWSSLTFEGIASMVAGVLTLAWPGISAFVLLMLIAVWSVVTGILEVVAAIRLRKAIEGEWLLALTGVLSMAFGVVLFLFPGAGALTLTLWVAVYALFFGVLLIALGFKVRAWGKGVHPDQHGRQVPSPA